MVELARRAVACKGWRWMAGMVAIHPSVSVSRVLFGHGYTFVGAYRRELKTKSPRWWQGWSGQVQHGQYGYLGFEHCTPIPDLTDPATLGCLLALVREAWGDPSIIAEPSLRMWEISRSDGCGLRTSGVWGGGGRGRGGFVFKSTEVEALVAALEIAL